MSIQNVSTFTDDSAEKQALDRQRQLALMLQNQSMQPIEGAQANGVQVPVSPLQGLAKMLQMYAGQKMNDRLDQKHQELSTKNNQALAQGLQQYQSALQGTPAVEGQPGIPERPDRPYSPMAPQGMPLAPTPSDVQPQQPLMSPAMPEQPGVPGQPAVPGDRQAALAQLLASNHPALQTLGMNQIAAEPDRQMKMEESAQKRQDAQSTLQAQLAAQQQGREENNRARAELAQQASQDRMSIAQQASQDRRFTASQNQVGQNKPPAGYRFTQDGSLEAIKGGPADAKLNTALSGKETVSNIVGGLRDSYDQLSSGGGITDPKNGALSNMAAGASSSALGQAAGRAFGTQNQSVRNSVAMTRPLLLQAIMKATGMSAKQMDSNTELKLYLSTATDPTLDVAANKRALDKIEELYGQGGHGGVSNQGGSSIDALLNKYK